MKAFITVFITGMVLVALERMVRTKEKKNGTSLKRFRIRLSKDFFWIGLFSLIFGWGVILGAAIEFSNSSASLRIWEIIILIPMIMPVILPGPLLMLGATPGFWEVQIDQDDITVTKFFILKKHFLFSEIVRCKEKRGGWKVYVKDRKRTAFFVDRMKDGAGLFIKRATKEGVEFEEMVRKEGDNFGSKIE